MSDVVVKSIEATDMLFAAYRALPGNASKSRNDFYSFLTTPSAERDAFVDANTEDDGNVVGDIYVINQR